MNVHNPAGYTSKLMKADGGVACFNSGFIESSFVVYIFDTNGFAVLKSELSQMYVRSYDMYIIAICCESVFSIIILPDMIKPDNTKLMDEWKKIEIPLPIRTRVTLSSHLVVCAVIRTWLCDSNMGIPQILWQGSLWS